MFCAAEISAATSSVGIGAPPIASPPARAPAAAYELTDRGQPLGDRRGLIAGGLTHHLDELCLRHAFEAVR